MPADELEANWHSEAEPANDEEQPAGEETIEAERTHGGWPELAYLEPSVNDYLKAKAELDRAMAGSEVRAQRQALHAFNDVCSKLGRALFWEARKHWGGAGPEDLGEVAQNVMVKLIERDRPENVAAWLRGEILRAAVRLPEEAGQMVLDYQEARDGDENRQREILEKLRTLIKGGCGKLTEEQVATVLNAIKERRLSSKRPDPAKALGWLLRQVERQVLPSGQVDLEIRADIGQTVLDLERARNARDTEAESQILATLTSAVGERLGQFFESDVPSGVLDRVLDRVKYRNHPGALCNWMAKKAVRTTVADYLEGRGKEISLVDLQEARQRRRPSSVGDEEGGEVEIPDGSRRPDWLVHYAEQRKLRNQARDHACDAIQRRCPKYHAQRARRVFELWIGDWSREEIRKAMRHEHDWSLGDANVYQTVTRYRQKLSAISAELRPEEREFIEADAEASRRKRPSGTDAHARPIRTILRQP
jgi:hypothetical protein